MKSRLVGGWLLLMPFLGGCLQLPWGEDEAGTASPEATLESPRGDDPAAPPGREPSQPILGKKVVLPSGLMYIDLVLGKGASPRHGSRIQVHYTQTLSSGDVFDSTKGREPFGFVYGVDPVIPGWLEGLKTMREGGSRKLILPPALAFGEKGRLGVVPPHATIICDVHLVAVEPPPGEAIE